jgi:hypothetical protein
VSDTAVIREVFHLPSDRRITSEVDTVKGYFIGILRPTLDIDSYHQLPGTTACRCWAGCP